MGARRVRVLLYCEANLNLIDGSSVWVQSVCSLLSAAGVDVTLLLRAKVDDTRLLDPIESYSGVTVVRAVESGRADGPLLSASEAVAVMCELDRQQPFDVVLLRGRSVAVEAAREHRFAGRIWPYLLDIPQTESEITDGLRRDVEAIAASSRLFLWQTEQLRDFAEGRFPATAGASAILPPVAPRIEFPIPPRESLGDRPWRLGYMGKMAPLWLTLEMTALPALLGSAGELAELHMIGDKINRDPRDPSYQQRMLTALGGTSGVIWHGGLPRQEGLRIASTMDVGLSLRGPGYDRLEIATKALEFLSLGVPVVVNRSPMYEEALGADYPLFAETVDDAAAVIPPLLHDSSAYLTAVERGLRAGAYFSFEESVRRVRALLEREFPGRLPE